MKYFYALSITSVSLSLLTCAYSLHIDQWFGLTINKNMKNEKLKKNKDRALAYGEVTGHSHRVDVDVYEREDGLREFSGSTTIKHEEHKPIKVPNKEWVSDVVVEFDYLQKIERKVID